MVVETRILGLGTSVPTESYSQHEVLDRLGLTDPRVRALFLKSGIERRNLIIPPPRPDGRASAETQGKLLAKHKEFAVRLAKESLMECMASIGAAASDVGHLCCVTSTGLLTPGLSALLVRELSLNRHCSRLDIVGMGCNAGLNGLNSTAAWSRSNPKDLALMVCTEICSAAYVSDDTMRSGVVNSLFGDGAAAVAVSSAVSQDRLDSPALVRFSSYIVPESMDAMRFDWDDAHGKFSFFLDRSVPYVIGAHVEAALKNLLAETGLCRNDIAHWIVHAGGKKVIDSVRVNLRLTKSELRNSTKVLKQHGNLSSGSFLFSLNELNMEHRVQAGDFGVIMTMGPGATIEMSLIRW
ncbi:3,5-dihydroxyphenylacetyl-CoA synthase DpgA [Nocardia brasiliensis]|uniref:3,5-dihydroxyphenylacetyl-CoA synthase DpgA n=1 Tax=Nocardia brasiliensis TaxID=37326 RepID=UPI002456738D|nr:3,5-dihydroxyphenylacetyl-CoA synthase DpgA [Nocardia brasiliensis]